MTRNDAFKNLIVSLRRDHAKYEAFNGLLEQQFSAALQHDAIELSRIGAEILELAEVLSRSLKERRALVRVVAATDRPTSVDTLVAKLKGAPRELLAREWARLVKRVAECKRLNTRNAGIVMAQFEVMQRALAMKDDIYVPH
ncbi:flagellar protein FlgN [Trinickia mobilis]|uniref:flagellar protein FlgN n=1 Tax=Trinickia mobilis TaxID=2816356 RepID=UPI001A8CF3FE|nr:flagellar protein FlgN [Trinickia mobilis]